MADFSNTWGPRSEQGGYMLSNIKSLYKSPDMKWVVNPFLLFYISVNNGLVILRPLLLSAMTKSEL